MTKPPITFPILTVGPQYGSLAEPGKERLDWYFSEYGFTCAEAWDRRHRQYSDTLIVDAYCKTWRIATIRDRGPFQALLRILGQGHRVRYGYAPAAPLSFNAIKARVCRLVEENPQDWKDYLLFIGEPDEDPTEEEYNEFIKTKIRLTQDAACMVDLIKALSYLYPGDMGRDIE
jgi:hypothetical protein